MIDTNEYLKNVKGSERNKWLKLWCDSEDGRTTKLSQKLFSNTKFPKTGISHYKRNRNISDELWNKMIVEIMVMDAIGNPFAQYETLLSSVDEWLTLDRDIKLMLGDALYTYKFMTDLTPSKHNLFTMVAERNRNLKLDDNLARIIKVIMKVVDHSILTKDQYYIAAKRAV